MDVGLLQALTATDAFVIKINVLENAFGVTASKPPQSLTARA